jgi:hypothetical protein
LFGSRGRWIAVADICGDSVLGLGLSAGDAVRAALSELGGGATEQLLLGGDLPTGSC